MGHNQMAIERVHVREICQDDVAERIDECVLSVADLLQWPRGVCLFRQVTL